jgi:hypothetical protein
MSKQVSIKNLDLTKLSYTQLNKGKNGGKVMYLLSNGETLRIQMPKMSMPFGATDYKDNKKFSINFSFDMNLDSHKKAFDVLQALDTKLINDASINSKEWFGTERTVEGIKDSFQSQLKVPDDSKYQPRLKAGLMTSNQNNGFRCNFVDMEGNKINVTEENVYEMIPSRSTGTAILECVGIWIVQKSLTLTWKVSKMKYEKGTSDELDFDSESDSDTAPVKTAPVKTAPVKTAPVVEITPTVMESEESEESSEESDKDEEPPKPVVLKRVSSKAKKALAV